MNESDNNAGDDRIVVDFPYQPDVSDELDAIDHEIIRLKLEFPNMTQKEIAARLKLHKNTICDRWQKASLQKHVREAQKGALQILLDSQAEAARRLKVHMRDADPDISIKACKEILKGVLSETMNLNINRMGRQRLVDLMEAEDVDAVKEEIKSDEADTTATE